MKQSGPPLELLLHRIADTPADFLAEPRLGKKDGVEVAAVVADLCRSLGTRPDTRDLVRLHAKLTDADRNRLAVALIASWLLFDPWFRDQAPSLESLLSVLVDGAEELGRETPARKFVEDPERREELARFVLARLGYRPAGESVAQAEDRLTGLSAAERTRVLKAARAAEERAKAIREALARKAAQESADKWSRE
jgi:hypothetical protein